MTTWLPVAACGAHPQVSLQTEENKSVCATHTAILEALLHGSPDDVSEALESHLSRYKQSVAQARSIHPEYFIDE